MIAVRTGPHHPPTRSRQVPIQHNSQWLLSESDAMPYASIDDLPFPIRAHLPEKAQEIYLSAFNHAWLEYGDREPAHVEETAHRVAWSAVKRKYQKIGAHWIERAPGFP